MLKSFTYRVAEVAGLNALARRLRSGAVVLCYHNVVAEEFPVVDPALHLSLRRFIEQVDWLRRYFAIVGIDELADRARTGRRLRGLAAITFDDAYAGTVRHALPVLRSEGLPTSIFVPTAYPGSGRGFWWDQEVARGAATDLSLRGRLLEDLAGDASRILAAADDAPLPRELTPASWEEIRAAAGESVRIEAHSVSHRTLPCLDDPTLTDELQSSADAIEAEVGVRPRWLAYPYGRWDPRVAAAVIAAGYRGGLTLDGRDMTARSPLASVPRINIPSSLSLDAFAAWISGLSHLRS